MRISSGTIAANSTHVKKVRGKTSLSYRKEEKPFTSVCEQVFMEREGGDPVVKNKDKDQREIKTGLIRPTTEDDFRAISVRQQFLVLAALLRRLILDRLGGGVVLDPLGFISRGGGQTLLVSREEMTLEESHEEEEETSVSILGKAETKDGRSIDFNIDVSMSRVFKETCLTRRERTDVKLLDPIVINLDAPAAAIRDQSFSFDLDGDGKKEEIGNLYKGSAFLALDRDQDGKINNGTELFGARSGNGFRELSVLDEDGDGWIDEDDSAFQDLKVMTVNPDGSQSLLSLAAADVGAICLRAQASEFSLTDDKNALLGQVRSTGVYLHEDGRTGSVQEVDLALH